MTSPGRTRILVLGLLAAAVILITLDVRDFGILKDTEDAVETATEPLRDVFSAAFEPVGDAWSAVGNYNDIRNENERLHEEISLLRGQSLQNQVSEATLADLLEELDISWSTENTKARVIRQVGNFDGFTIDIDKGSNSGIKTGMPVVAGSGLVGRVSEVRSRSSEVQLITAPDFVVGVHFPPDSEAFLAVGTGLSQPLQITKREEINSIQINTGDLAVTSGVNRSLYPPDIPVGIVSRVETSQSSLESVISIEPTADLKRLQFVTILLYLPEVSQ